MLAVAPLAGAWIEINRDMATLVTPRSLPSRERGLKSYRNSLLAPGPVVAPLAGAWIEIMQLRSESLSDSSLPSRERGLK